MRKLDLTFVYSTYRSKVEILQIFVAFSEYMNFNNNNYFRNFRTAIEHELHMVFHAYVTYLKKIRFEKENSTSSTLSRNTQNNSAGLKMARYLVRTSIKRLLPKKTLDTSTTPKHLDGELEKHVKWKCLFTIRCSTCISNTDKGAFTYDVRFLGRLGR